MILYSENSEEPFVTAKSLIINDVTDVTPFQTYVSILPFLPFFAANLTILHCPLSIIH